MIGIGDHHKDVPKDYLGNLAFREKILLACENDQLNQQAILKACREDVIFWFDVFAWQYNPNKPPQERVGPFILWDFQEEALVGERGLLWCIENRKTAAIAKSRELGATWVILGLQDWLDAFTEYHQCLTISKSADAVYRAGDPNSLFWKVDFLHQNMPLWLTGKINSKVMSFNFERTNSSMTGEASTGRAGVSGRASDIFVDEFSQIKEAVEVRQRTASTSDVRFFCGTHLGVGTEFYRLTQPELSPEIVQIVWHWSQHPDKNKGLYRWNPTDEVLEFFKYERGELHPCERDHGCLPLGYPFVTDGSPTGGPFPGLRSPWYDKKSGEIGSERGVAMDLDINPRGAVSQFFNAITIRSLTLAYCCEPFWTGDIEVNLDGTIKKLVRKPGGPLNLWLHPPSDSSMPLAQYAAGLDLGWGTGATPTCMTGVNARTGDKVLEYANANIEPYQMAPIAAAICRMCMDESGQGAMFAWEAHGPGMAFAKNFLKLGYQRFFRHTVEQPVSMTRKVSEVPGWYPTPDAINLLLNEYANSLYSRMFINRSRRALEETLNFRYNDLGGIEHTNIKSVGDPSGARVAHGDRCVADALACKMMIQMNCHRDRPEEKAAVRPDSFAGRRLARGARELVTKWF